MWLLSKLFILLFSKHKCLVYTALGYEEYFKIVNKLESYGINFRTVTRYSIIPVSKWSPRENQNVPYEIYIKSEDEYKAQQAIHDRSM